MTAPVPEFQDAPAPSNQALMSAADANAINSSAKFSLPDMLAKLRVNPVSSGAGAVSGPKLGDVTGGGSGADLGSVVKNIVDFIETPFYMLTNAADTNVQKAKSGQDTSSIGAMLDTLGQGVSKGVQGGIGHDPTYTKDWTDVINDQQKGTPREGENTVGTTIGGIAGDMLLDPINLIPGTGLGKTAIKAPGIVAGALKDASKGAGALVDRAAETAAAKTAEPLATAAVRPTDATAEAAGAAGSDAVAEAPTALYGPDEAKESFKQIPEIAKVLQAQQDGPVKSVLNALGGELKTNWQASDANKYLQGAKEFLSKPMDVPVENVEKAHVEAALSPTLKEQPVTTMAAPKEPVVDPKQDIVEKHFGTGNLDTYNSIHDIATGAPYHPFKPGQTSMFQDWYRRLATPEDKAGITSKLGLADGTTPNEVFKELRKYKEPYMNAEKDLTAVHLKPSDMPRKEANQAALKAQDLSNSAAQNTLAHVTWEGTSPEERQAVRNQMAYTKWDDLKTPHEAGVQITKGVAKDVSPTHTISPEEQQAAASNVLNKTKDLQVQAKPEIGEKGYRGDIARTKGASAEKAGAITHPLLYDTHANQLPLKETLEQLASISKGAGEGRRISAFAKPYVVSKIMRAVETQLQAKGMIPFLNSSKYFEKEGAIHLTFGDTLEAALAKTLDGVKDKSVISRQTIQKHLIGSARENAVNPMTWLTANETLLHERKAIFDGLKAKSLQNSPGEISKALKKAEDSVYQTLMVKPEAFGDKVTKADIQNMARTRAESMFTRNEKGIPTSYEEDMRKLAHAMVYDPQYGSMLEQRHIYNAAMHEADLMKYTSNTWRDILPSLEKFAATSATPQKITRWLDREVKDASALLPPNDRAAYNNWLDGLISAKITPEEKIAVHAVDPKETIEASGRAAEDAYKASGTEYTHIDLELGKLATDTLRALHPVKSFFEAKFPFLGSQFYDTVKMGEHSQNRLNNAFNQNVRAWLMKHTDNNALHESFKDIVKNGIDKTDNLTPEAEELNKVVGILFGDDQRYMNAMKEGKLPKEFVGDVLKSNKYNLMSKVDGKWWASAKNEDLPDLYKHMNLNNSQETADFLSKFHSAIVHMNNQLSIARSFEERFGSKVANADNAKLRWDTKGQYNNIVKGGYQKERIRAEQQPGLWELLDKDLHYDKTAAWEIPAIHRLINESRTISNDGAIGKFVNNVFDPMTQVMKATQTTLRPGHWVSNVMGDTIRNFLAGVTDPRSYAYNMRVLAAIGRDEALFKDSIGSHFERATLIANGKYAEKIPAAERKYMVPVRINGTVKYYTATELGRMMEDKIFLSPHGVGGHEDYITPEERDITSKITQKLVNGTDAVLSNKHFDLNKWSAVRDNLTRGALAMDTVIHGDHASIEAAMDKAFNMVRKWAPTSADFTREESMYARRALLYYTWIRGMVPNIIETMVEKPGVFMAPNKALYAMAKQNGVDPMSIGNPFPMNKLFPSYYYENIIGPQFQAEGGQLWGFSPMAPSIDVLQTILKPNPAANLLGMANPLAKIPIEMATGQSNGIPIKDPAQYLQDNLLPPQLDMISKATGKELYNPGQNRTDKGNSQPVPGTGIPADVFNFFTGLHATDYTSQADLRSVAAEAKANKSAQRSDIQRTNR